MIYWIVAMVGALARSPAGISPGVNSVFPRNTFFAVGTVFDGAEEAEQFFDGMRIV